MVKRDYFRLLQKYADIIDDALQKYKINSALDLHVMMQESVEVRSVICLHLAQIGELSNKLPDDFKQEHNDINWRALYRTRNIITHDYDAVSYGIVADMVYSHVLPLRQILLNVLEKQKPDKEKPKIKDMEMER